MRHAAALAVAMLGLALAACPASAAVQATPAEAVIGEQQDFQLRVSGEGEAGTVGLRVTVPDEIRVASLGGPPPDWSAEPVEGGGGRIRGVLYRGGEIAPGQSADFTLVGTPVALGTAAWQVEEVLENGAERAWTGAPEGPDTISVAPLPGEPGPAPAVEVVERLAPPPASGEGGGGGAEATDEAGGGNDAAIWLGAIAIVLAIGALVGAGLLWTRRPPADLPPDAS